MTIKEKIQNELQKIISGETEKITIAAEGCSIGYLRNCVATSSIGQFSTKHIRGTNLIEITLRKESTKSISVVPNIEEPDIAINGIFEEGDIHYE